LQDLDWLIGDWTAQGTKSLPLQNSWSANHHLIKLESKDNSGEFQLIGWNPATKQIVSWHFDAEGGFGWGKWYQLGDTWIENASAIRADGKTAHATYLLHKLSNNKFTWHSTDRSLNGQSVPDLAAIEVSRDK
jgi:hypothetical protein